MRDIQKETVFLIPVSGSQKFRITKMKYAGQIVEYFILAESKKLSFSILINGIPLPLNVAGERIPLFYPLQADDEIEVYGENGDSTVQEAVVVTLIRED